MARVALEPQDEEDMLREARISFKSHDFDGALRQLDELTRTNPRMHEAWILQAQCFRAKAMQSEIKAGQVQEALPEWWLFIGEESLNFAFTAQALDCYYQAELLIERDGAEPQLRARLMLGMACARNEAKSDHSHFSNLLSLLAKHPHLKSEVFQEARLRLRYADHFITLLSALERRDLQRQPDNLTLYDAEDIARHAQLLIKADRPWSAIEAIRDGQRWLQGRSDDVHWKLYEQDDREFDQTHDDDARATSTDQVFPLSTQLRGLLGIARLALAEACSEERSIVDEDAEEAIVSQSVDQCKERER